MPDYWEKNKQRLLPWVKDWSDPQDHIRKSNKIKQMTWNDWFYCHPSAYKLIYYGFDSQGSLIFGLLSWFLFSKGNMFFGWFMAIFSAFMLFGLIKKIINRKTVAEVTLYDLYMREYHIKDNKEDIKV